MIDNVQGEPANAKIVRKRNDYNTTKSYDTKGAMIAAAKKDPNPGVIQDRASFSPKTQQRRQSISPVLELNEQHRLHSQVDPVQILDRKTEMETSTNGNTSYFNAKFHEL